MDVSSDQSGQYSSLTIIQLCKKKNLFFLKAFFFPRKMMAFPVVACNESFVVYPMAAFNRNSSFAKRPGPFRRRARRRRRAAFYTLGAQFQSESAFAYAFSSTFPM